jgi:hypothetical protein
MLWLVLVSVEDGSPVGEAFEEPVACVVIHRWMVCPSLILRVKG